MEALSVILGMLWITIQIIGVVCQLGATAPEKPIRPGHERPDEVNPPLDGRAIAGYVSSTSPRAARDGGFFLANRGTSAHPLWDREVDG